MRADIINTILPKLMRGHMMGTGIELSRWGQIIGGTNPMHKGTGAKGRAEQVADGRVATPKVTLIEIYQ